MTDNNGSNQDKTDTVKEKSAITFNPKFYAERELILIKKIRKFHGCFNSEECRNKNVSEMKQCSRCRFVIYCTRSCGASHWSEHKPFCDWITSCRKDGNHHQNLIPFMLTFTGCYFCGNLELEKEMEIYSDMFIEEMSKQNKKEITLTLCCVKDDAPDKDDIVRLIGEGVVYDSSFMSSNSTHMRELNHILFYEVDSGPKAICGLYPDGYGMAGGSPGTIAESAKVRVVTRIVQFLVKLQRKGVKVTSMTCGRGLMWLPDDTEAKDKFDEAQLLGTNGQQICVLPDMNYFVTNYKRNN